MKLYVGLQNLGLCSAAIAFEQEIFFYRAAPAMFSIYTRYGLIQRITPFTCSGLLHQARVYEFLF